MSDQVPPDSTSESQPNQQNEEAQKEESDSLEALKERAAIYCQQIQEGREYVEEVVPKLRSRIGSLDEKLATLDARLTETARVEADIKASAQAIREIQELGVANKSAIETILKEIEGGKTQALGLGNEIAAIKDSAQQSQAEIAKRSGYIDDAIKHADKTKAELDELIQKTKKSLAEADSSNAAIKTVADQVKAIEKDVVKIKTEGDVHADTIAKAKAAVEADRGEINKLAQLANKTEARIKNYQDSLVTLEERAETNLINIEKLLAGAVSAGLATSFDRRSRTFKLPEFAWNAVFVGSLLVLLVWAIRDYEHLVSPQDWQGLLRALLSRFPMLVPLVWLALHAAKQAALAKRLEEEYAFKATTAASFEGFRRQMEEVGSTAAPGSPLATLYSNTLRTIAEHPGRVYDDHPSDPTPVSAAAEALAQVVGNKAAEKSKAPDPKQ